MLTGGWISWEKEGRRSPGGLHEPGEEGGQGACFRIGKQGGKRFPALASDGGGLESRRGEGTPARRRRPGWLFEILGEVRDRSGAQRTDHSPRFALEDRHMAVPPAVAQYVKIVRAVDVGSADHVSQFMAGI